MNIIVGIYFNNTPDIQRGNTFTQGDNFDYIKRWHETAQAHGIKCLLLVDNSCTDSFINQHSSEFLEFVRCDKKYTGNINTTKFLHIKDVLCQRQLSNVFMTDVSDVTFLKNPFDLIVDDTLFVGCEQSSNGTIYKCRDSQWARNCYSWTMAGIAPGAYVSIPMLSEISRTRPPEKCFPYWDEDFLNCGIVGGSYDTVMKFLTLYEKIYGSLSKWPEDLPNDMIITTLVAHTHFKNKIKTGLPLHTIFKKYENDHPEAYIVHK